MNGSMCDNLKSIQALESQYGHVLFGMGLTHLFDTGLNNINDSVAEEGIKQIMAEGKCSIMTPEFQCEIIRCSAALAKFSPMTLFAYIKKHMHIGGV